jgi:hypothetical protein
MVQSDPKPRLPTIAQIYTLSSLIFFEYERNSKT